MSARQALSELLERLPEERVRKVLEFARLLSGEEERDEWARFGREQFARAYGPDEPDYTPDDLKPRRDQ